MDNIIITGHNYSSNSHYMLINILSVVLPILFLLVFVSIRYSKKASIEQKKCGCGRSASGYCDGSHNDIQENKDNNSGA